MLFSGGKSKREDAQVSQGSVVPLMERSDEIFSVGQFFLPTGDEVPQDAWYFRQESIEVFPLFPKGILSVQQTWIYQNTFKKMYFIRL